jgi:hypothetical protein
MATILSRGVVTALALGIAVATSNAAQAASHHHHKWRASAPRTDYLLYSYSYHPILGYSLYGNCYWVEDFAPYRPHLIRTCDAP